MPPPKQKLLTLPNSILEELGGEGMFINIILIKWSLQTAAALSGNRKRTRPGSRKEARKAERIQKKGKRADPQRNGLPPQKRVKIQHEEDFKDEELVPEPSSALRKRALTEEAVRKPKSILKRTKKLDPETRSDEKKYAEHVQISRAVKNKLAEDDDEIAALEKKLGLKGKKGLPQSFKDDGLDELLDGLDDIGEEGVLERKTQKAEGDQWLEQKRAQARGQTKTKAITHDESSDSEGGLLEEGDEIDDGDGDGPSDRSLDGLEFPDDESGSEDLEGEVTLDVDSDFDGFESDDDDDDELESLTSRPRVRENPYVAPVVQGDSAAGKYIPPSLRKLSSSDTEQLLRLRRQIQGLVNRLTESNLVSILGDIEQIYRANPRHHVTATLVDLLLASVCEPTSLPDTLIILPAGFIAAVYKIIGTDFGANIIQSLVELFEEHYARAAAATSDSHKETSNLMMLLSELYNFQVVGSILLYDYIKLFLAELSELNTELLLKIIRASGPHLRQDDPSALKDIVAMLRPAVTAMGEENMSVRTKFMIETINDLKNNKMKTGAVASAVTSEHTIRMKKTLGTLNSRNMKASEPLRVGLKDIKESDKKGKWWLVGASWAGNDGEDTEISGRPHERLSKTTHTVDSGTLDLVELAREHRMNTDVRRAIFITIMSASDFQDAYLRLMKLKLKRVQELEIPKVLIHCSGGEKSYNPYYTLIAKKLCGDRRLKMAFQFSLWDLFKKMGETTDEDGMAEEEEQSLDTRQLVNLAKMFGTLVAEGGLGLNVLKNLNLSLLQPKTKTFVEVMFITIFLQSQRQVESGRDERAVVNVVLKVKDTPNLIRGLQYFLKKVVSKTDITADKAEKATVKWACKVTLEALEGLQAIDLGSR